MTLLPLNSGWLYPWVFLNVSLHISRGGIRSNHTHKRISSVFSPALLPEHLLRLLIIPLPCPRLHFLFSLRNVLSLLCYHLDWSVEHFVSLLSNHFKNTRTHTRARPHTHLSSCGVPICYCAWEREGERVSFDVPQIVFSSMPTTFSCFTSGQAATIWDMHCTISFSSPPPCVGYLRDLQDKQPTVTLPDDTL